GTEDNAGAFCDGQSMARLREAGHDPRDFVRKQDPYGAFDAIGDIFAPGPTGTNVNDFRAIFIEAET
ncbi:MAG: MOFRL family protein, partial [Sagittula sp.]